MASSDELVRRGQILGRIDNTGNSNAPHLHFHIVQAGSLEDVTLLQTNPVPYVIDGFEWRGKYNGRGLITETGREMRSPEIPLDGDVITFLP